MGICNGPSILIGWKLFGQKQSQHFDVDKTTAAILLKYDVMTASGPGKILQYE